jgi:hypothetical protein
MRASQTNPTRAFGRIPSESNDVRRLLRGVHLRNDNPVGSEIEHSFDWRLCRFRDANNACNSMTDGL